MRSYKIFWFQQEIVHTSELLSISMFKEEIIIFNNFLKNIISFHVKYLTLHCIYFLQYTNNYYYVKTSYLR